tara:strand:+ start:12543 stop:12698 length:156 start_codon:yes stop_codon:yes gene_type:complete
MKRVVKFENFDELNETKREHSKRQYSEEELTEWKEWAEKWMNDKMPEEDKG